MNGNEAAGQPFAQLAPTEGVMARLAGTLPLFWSSLVLLLLTSLAMSSTARARIQSQCSELGHHCFATATYAHHADAQTGSLAYIYDTRLHTQSPSTDFVTEEVWIGTNYQDETPGAPFVEAGLFMGYNPYFASHEERVFFTGEGDVNGTVISHFVGDISLGQTYITKISYNTNNLWAVYENGQWVWNTYLDQGTNLSLWTATGAESTLDSNNVDATSTILQKRLSDNTTWTYNWPGAGLSNADAPLMNISWLSGQTYAGAHYTQNP